MPPRFTTEKDPWDWCAVWAVFFLALVWWRLGVPSKIYFDEIHYVPAARKLLAGLRANPEHPLLGKWVIAEAIAWFGDTPLVWRAPSALCGALGLYGFTRLVWFASGRRDATLAAQWLVATDFAWFVQSRIAMLDMVMAMLGMAGLWLAVSAWRLPAQGRARLAGAGVLLGLALGAKWSVAPLLPLPGLAFAVLKWRAVGWRRLPFARPGGMVPGMSLAEAALWLGAVPALIYWLTFWPGFFWAKDPIPWAHPLQWHHFMLQLQDSVTRLHPYRSRWYQWAGNTRAIWYLYEVTDGAQRGVLLVGNPLTMWAGLPALGWCLWRGLRARRWDMAGFALAYLATLLVWAVNGKPIQFYYHYLLPGTFLMACLALTLDEVWRRADRWRWAAPLVVAGSVGMFAWFFPILAGLPLHQGHMSFVKWMWLPGWR